MSTFNSIPTALAEYVPQPRWVIWRKEVRDNGKPTKVPYQAKMYQNSVDWDHARTNDPATWRDAETALAAFKANGCDGIGFNILGSDIACFDVDNCRDPETGIILPFAEDLVRQCPTYCEVTPSGTGIRIIGKSNGGKIHRKQKIPSGDGASIESYRACERFVTVTGNRLPNAAEELADIGPIMDETVNRLDSGGSGRTTDHSDRGEPCGPISGAQIEPDDQRLNALSAKWIELGTNGTGIAEEYGGDRSRAVFAFACECMRQGIADDTIASCLMHWKIGDHVRDQFDVERAIRRTITRAREKVQDSKLFEMNEKHCVMPIGGKTRAVTWKPDRSIASVSSLEDFRALHDKYRHSYQREDGVTVTTRLGTWWVNHSARRQYDGGMRFEPTRDEDILDSNVLNLWQGFRVAARKPEGASGASDCQLLLDHGRKVICSGNDEHYDYLIKREALIAQKRVRSEVATGLRTEAEGTGKGIWSRALNYLYGAHALEVQNPEHVVGKHNPHLERLIRLTADEALFAGDPRHRNALYNLITEPRITIEPKFVNPYPADNHLNIDVISNALKFIPVTGFNPRRFFVPKVSEEKAGDFKYFKRILAQLADGGYEALLYHLLFEVDIRDFNVRDVPRTAMLLEQMSYSRKGVDLLVEQACNEAVVPCQKLNDPGVSITSGHQERRGFDYFIDHNRDRDLALMGALKVKRILVHGWGCLTGKATRRQQQGERTCRIEWPPLKELREKFEAKYGKQDWLVPEAEWQDEHSF